jgi:transposase-like protein
MNPHQQFCPNNDYPARGKVGAGNIVSHSQQEQRCKCTSCGRTFSIRKGTAMYGIKHSVDVFVVVVTLLAHGCPPANADAVASSPGKAFRSCR